MRRLAVAVFAAGLVGVASRVAAQESDTAPASEAAELAKKLTNPVANLVSVPFKLDWDTGIGPAKADRTSLTIQPVIPFSISANWNVISRTIAPIIWQQSAASGVPYVSGLGDTTQSFFFSPKAPTADGWIWGAGPVLVLPTASDTALGGGKWDIGPTVVVLRQSSGWTYGILANQIWSFAGPSSRSTVSAAFVQPFVSYTTSRFTTFGFNTESSYNWTNHQWVVPLNLTVGQLLKLGNQPVSFTLGLRYYADKPAGGPDWGLRFTTTLLFPQGRKPAQSQDPPRA